MASSQLALRMVHCAASGEDPAALPAARCSSSSIRGNGRTVHGLSAPAPALPNGLGLFSGANPESACLALGVALL